MACKGLTLLATAGLACIATLSCKPEGRPAKEVVELQQKPNIIIFLADDMGYSDLGCYGSEIPTPNIDALAQSGKRLTQFYNNGRCCPTRASLLTGLYAHSVGLGEMLQDRNVPCCRGTLNEHCVTFSELLKPAGYATFAIGKWHMTPFTQEHFGNWPLQRGFDQFYGTVMGGSYYEPDTLMRGNDKVEPPQGYFLTHALADEAARNIDLARAQEKPFLLYFAFTSPHFPLQAPEADVKRHVGNYRKGWEELRKDRLSKGISEGVMESVWGLSDRNALAEPWENVKDVEEQDRRMATYAAQVQHIDEAVGRVVGHLSAKERENTIILFLSDNGSGKEVIERSTDPNAPTGSPESCRSLGPGWAMASNTPFSGYKSMATEGSIATPFIAVWQGKIEDGIDSQTVAHAIDLMPTLLEAAGVEYPKQRQGADLYPLEGQSLLAPLTGRVAMPERVLYWEHEGNKAVRQGDYKLVSTFPGEWQLYNIVTDRTERNDLKKSEPRRTAELEALYRAWADKWGIPDEPLNPALLRRLKPKAAADDQGGKSRSEPQRPSDD